MRPAGPLRLHIGVQDPQDLIEDQERWDRCAPTGAAVSHDAVREPLNSSGGDARN